MICLFWSAGRPDRHFPATKMMTLKSVLAEMGLSVDSAEGLKITISDSSQVGFAP
jgi:hypothetical protein